MENQTIDLEQYRGMWRGMRHEAETVVAILRNGGIPKAQAQMFELTVLACVSLYLTAQNRMGEKHWSTAALTLARQLRAAGVPQ